MTSTICFVLIVQDASIVLLAIATILNSKSLILQKGLLGGAVKATVGLSSALKGVSALQEQLAKLICEKAVRP